MTPSDHSKDTIRILNKHLYGYEHPKDDQSGYRLDYVINPYKNLPEFYKRLIKNISVG